MMPININIIIVLMLELPIVLDSAIDLLIKPLDFVLDDNHLKRSGVNYIDKLDYQVYEDFNDFKEKNK